MTTKYKINPCKACEKKLSGGRCNVNTMNDCCYGTLAAFSGAISSTSINNSEAADNCKACVQKVMDGMGVFGRSECDLKLSSPPLWLQSPHYVPSLLNDGMDPENALKECVKLCNDTKYPNECKLNCQTDYDAVEIPVIENFTTITKSKDHKNDIFFIIVITILIALLIYRI